MKISEKFQFETYFLLIRILNKSPIIATNFRLPKSTGLASIRL